MAEPECDLCDDTGGTVDYVGWDPCTGRLIEAWTACVCGAVPRPFEMPVEPLDDSDIPF